MQIQYFISDRFGGISKPPYNWLNIAMHVGDNALNVEQNRKILYKKAGIKNAQFANQVHGDRIVEITEFITPPSCDGFITTKASLPLAIMSADCFGVLLYDKSAKVIAALHAGRAGTTKQIVAKAMQLMQKRYGATNISAIISPGIHSCCYEIDQNLAIQYPRRFIKKDRFLDIKAMIYEQLEQNRIQSIKDYNICTCCSSEYYSYRREKQTGRFASIIWMEE